MPASRRRNRGTCRRCRSRRPSCVPSARRGSPASASWRPIRARARPCCAWPSDWRWPRDGAASHAAVGPAAGGHRQRHCRGLGAPGKPHAVHAAVETAERARPPQHRVRAPRAGTGHLGRPGAHRSGCARQARHGRAQARRYPVDPPMSMRGTSSRIDTPRRGRGPSVRKRLALVVVLLALASAGLVVRAVDLQVIDKSFYQEQGNERFLRTVSIPVSRGTIFDRNGVPLAVSTPVESLWANPQKLLDHTDRIPDLARALGVDPGQLAERLSRYADREFVYLKRQMSPDAAQAVLDLKIPGVNERREYRRFYPSGSITAHVIGFTNIDGKGLAGLELAYNKWLTGKAGAKKIIRNGNGRTVENVELVRKAQPGHDLTLSIDRRIQYLAWRALKDTMDKYHADSASMIVMDPRTGEVLAMVNLPSYNPNDLDSRTAAERRNRTITDVFEPGSTAKAFTVTAALMSGK